MYDSMGRQGELSFSPISNPGGFEDMQSCTASLPSDTRALLLTTPADPGRYFRFPSFDIYEPNQQDEDKEGEIKSP